MGGGGSERARLTRGLGARSIPEPAQALLPPSLARRWVAAMRDELVPSWPADLGAAADILQSCILREQKQAEKQAIRVWRQQFSRWTPNTSKAAAAYLRPAAPPLSFSALLEQNLGSSQFFGPRLGGCLGAVGP